MIPIWGTSSGRNGAGGIPSLLLDFSNQSYLLNGTGYAAFGASPGITFSRGTNATLIDSTGKLTYAPSNMFTNSENFSATGWAHPDATINVNSIVAPDGTITADKIIETATTNTHQITQTTTFVSGTVYNWSFFVKAAERSVVRVLFPSAAFTSNLGANFDITVGAWRTSSPTPPAALTLFSQDVGDGWYRISATAKATASVSSTILLMLVDSPSGTGNYTGNVTDGLYIWGAQLGAVTYETAPRTYNSTTPKNLLGYTEEFNVTTSGWTKFNSTITANATTDPNGNLNADKLVEQATTQNHNVNQAFSFVAGVPYTYSVYAKAAERQYIQILFVAPAYSGNFIGVFDLTGSGATAVNVSGVTSSITSVGNGWYRCSITSTATTAGSATPQIRVTTSFTTTAASSTYLGDGTSGVYLWGAQLSDSASLDPYVYNPAAALTSTAYYGPRFDYSPTTLAPLGLLIEEARTNLLLYSDRLDVAATWISANIDVTANAIVSPDGTTNADAIIEKTTPTVFHYINQSVTKAASSIQYALSFYVKNKGRDIVINIQSSGVNGVAARINPETGNIVTGIAAFGTGWTAGSLTTTSVGDGWYKVVMVATSDTAITAQFQCSLYNAALVTNIYTGDGVSGVYIWGAQLEAGSFATSYIPTAGASVTRSADVATMVGNNFSNWYNQTTGTLAVAFDASANGFATYVSASNGTITQNSTHIDNDTGIMRAAYYSGSALVTALGLGAIGTVGATNKIATAYAVNDFAASRNGGTVATFTSPGAVPVGLTQLNIGADDRLLAANYTSNHIKSISYYNTRLTDTLLQAITA